MELISRLTPEQIIKAEEYHDRYFSMATCINIMDRDRASRAADRLIQNAGIGPYEIHFVESPEMAESLCESFADHRKMGSVGEFLSNEMSCSRVASIRDYLLEDILNSVKSSVVDSAMTLMANSLLHSLNRFLRSSLNICKPLWSSLCASTWGAGFLCFCTFSVDELGIEISEDRREILGLYNEIIDSCFAIWVVPGHVIICDRPRSVEIKDGKLVNVEW